MFCEHCGKKISQGNQFCEFCGKEQGVNEKVPTSLVASPVSAGGLTKWLSHKNLLGFAAVLIAISLFYYFLIRPVQEKRAYEDCFVALSEAGQLPMGMQTSEKNFRIDSCVKSRNADEIRRNYQLEKIAREAEQEAKDTAERNKIEQERVRKEAKSIPEYFYGSSIKIQNMNFPYNHRITGSIKNDLAWNIENLVIHLDFFTDKSTKNKIGETDCSLSNFIVYADTVKKFDTYCYLDDNANWINYRITSAEKAL